MTEEELVAMMDSFMEKGCYAKPKVVKGKTTFQAALGLADAVQEHEVVQYDENDSNSR